MATVREALQTAFAHHQAGRLREAELLYRQVVSSDPRQADAWHLLGLVAHQVGQHAAAEQSIGRAIALVGNRALFHANLGPVLEALGKLDEAEQSLRRALLLEPGTADVYNNLGNVCTKRGHWDEAASAYREAIRLRQDFPEAHNNLATLLHRQGDLDAAIAHYRQALAARPHYADACNNLGTALQAQGKLDEAAETFRRAIELAPQSSDAHLNLGTVLQAQVQFDAAVRSYREAVRLDPQYALAHNNLGAALREQNQLSEAQGCLQQAIHLNPRLPDAHYNLALVEHALGDTAEEEAAYRRAIECDPAHARSRLALARLLERDGRLADALAELEQASESDSESVALLLAKAEVHAGLGNFQQAVAAYRELLRLEPDHAQAANDLAVLYSDLGLVDAAVESFEQALVRAPNAAALYANLAAALARQGRQQEAIAAVRRAVELRPESSIEYSNLLYLLNFVPDVSPQQLFEEHCQWARRHAEPMTALAPPNTNDPSPQRRLRVGYVSPYFREHAVNFFVEPLLAAHDHDQFEISCYSDARKQDAATERLRAAADQWRDVRGESDASLAELVRRDAIDILVDLTGHIAGSRLLAFARRPAPVQVTYIGYQNTTGMSAMDYRLSDERADPPGHSDALYTERLVRLPGSYFCYRPADNVPAVTPLPALSAGHVTFGSFNNFMKITPPAIDAWLEILARVPEARLLVLASRGGYVERHLAQRARAAGIDPDRIEVSPPLERQEYYKLVQRADIALDAFPFNGHTTTCDAVWLGVPVVMLLGEVYAARFGSSVLANVGLDDLIAASPEQYIDVAVRLAGDVDRLVQLRGELRGRMAASPLLDFAGFARQVERAYRQMWTEWCQNRPERTA